jgi:hypothetical protein
MTARSVSLSATRRLSAPLLALALAIGPACAANAPAVAPRPGAMAPDFTLSDAAGKNHSLADYRGK